MEKRFAAPVQTDPRPNQQPVRWVPGLFSGVKKPGRGVDHTPLSRDEIFLWSFMACSRVNLAKDRHSCFNDEITKRSDINLESKNTLKQASSNGTRWLQIKFIAINLV